jgi:hypothetical protein
MALTLHTHSLVRNNAMKRDLWGMWGWICVWIHRCKRCPVLVQCVLFVFVCYGESTLYRLRLTFTAVISETRSGSGGEAGRTCAGYPPSVQVLSYRDWYALDLYTYLEAAVGQGVSRSESNLGVGTAVKEPPSPAPRVDRAPLPRPYRP